MWMVTTDDRGFVKYWQSNFNNVHTFQAHSDPVKCSRLDVFRHACKCHINNGHCSKCDALIVMIFIDLRLMNMMITIYFFCLMIVCCVQ